MQTLSVEILEVMKKLGVCHTSVKPKTNYLDARNAFAFGSNPCVLKIYFILIARDSKFFSHLAIGSNRIDK